MIVLLKFILVSISLIAISKANSIGEEFVPDIFDTVPTSCARVVFPDGCEAKLGNKLSISTIIPQPDITWDTDPGVFYTLIMIDVDAPKPPGKTAFIHLAINNIEGTDLETASKTDGAIYQYVPQAAAPETYIHRFLQLVYQQDCKIDNSRVDTALNNVKGGNRLSNFREFLKRFNLKNPIAWNFFRAGMDVKNIF